ncbi:E3 ubiquitin-protein ligase CHIP-like [Cydia splendana]|uniref:E3 ubiquitin-protein ligase CHIP-like n=1 Tax=Cydia splendana TaxID=1100963 RepID=UPI0021272537
MSKRKHNNLYSTANLSDKELKEEGNRLFSLRRYEDAIVYYTKAILAIIKNPSVATYYTKRALCHLKVERWEATCQDCRRALDYAQIKGHLFLGQALVELELYDEAVKHLHRADDLAREQKLNFGDEIAAQLRIARKKRCNVQEEKITQEIELQIYLNRLISEDMQRRKRKASKGKTANIEEECNNYTSELNNLFAKIDDRRRKRDVPDYLCGKISFEILRDPVITPSGITYERNDIEEHLERVGHFDPQTRVELTADQRLIPNLSMREVVDSFLQENEWALDY